MGIDQAILRRDGGLPNLSLAVDMVHQMSAA